MRFALSLVMLAFLASAADPPPATVNDVVALVRAGLAANRDDKQIAKSLSKVKLRESLDAYPVEELESAGAGPKTLQELYHRREISADLPLPEELPRFTLPAVPSLDEILAAL